MAFDRPLLGNMENLDQSLDYTKHITARYTAWGLVKACFQCSPFRTHIVQGVACPRRDVDSRVLQQRAGWRFCLCKSRGPRNQSSRVSELRSSKGRSSFFLQRRPLFIHRLLLASQ